MATNTYGRVTAGLAGLATTAALVLTGAAPAGAQTVGRDDSGADVFTWDTSASPATVTPSSRTTNVAVERVVVKHTRSAFVVATQMSSLARNGDYFYLNAVLTLPDETTYSSFLVVEPDDRNGRSVLQSPAGGSTIACRTMTHTVDYRADRLRLVVPRSCFGAPASFQVSGAVIDYPAGAPGGRVHVDQLFSETRSSVKTEPLARG
ncbi:hypothetical protein G7072_17230 [Nocardioides sp. HDW12B]|uniref:hypothetical protein n=1 Tax=Nocardioides sp. HDW12B TaxID=2714939 RepID=UPI00140CA9D8|nr:hypothetical protein [Nocardioides sp. HDW12B]QIK67855.1 hypothetical protein G7072_17230 [Nocardioides sp. HDW12B]